MHAFTTAIETPDGAFTARFSDQGLTALEFPHPKRRTKAAPGGAAPPKPVRAWVELTRRALLSALKGKPPAKLPPLDTSDGTAFQQAVWTALRAIPSGQTRTYGQVAASVQRPRGMRAVGQACGANPLPVLIPCHRVLAAGGRLGGFTAGLDWKRRLLEREGLTGNG